ncbi:52 kDa repressor of the inhibitor of the protein kinase [Drosophila grimshawi]|uniref:GH21630 n=1 Tax=Drosophila grimshawi TaxID=7222 RepID=B4J5D6_DROGR|nr:52 kDa repressor of the inhibitor of the protein kinase [Drosophila grimshawi]EDW01778.1 GH21630 [Drosophila grimshawi]
MTCAVADCTKPKSRNRYFSFPQDAKLCAKWVRFCRRPDTIDTKLEKICVDHFQAGDFERDLPYELGVYSKPRPLKLKPGSVPSVHQNISDGIDRDYDEDQPTETWADKAKRKQIVDALLTEYDEDQAQDEIADDDTDASQPAEEIVQVMVDAEDYLTELEDENTTLRRENFKMKITAEKDVATISKLQEQLSKSNERYDQLFNHLRTTFSTAQIQKLQSGKRIVWPQRDLRESYELYANCPPVYNMLLQRRYPLPSQRTLQHWDATERLQLQLEEEEEEKDHVVEHVDNEEQTEQVEQLVGCEFIEIIDITHLDHNYVSN